MERQNTPSSYAEAQYQKYNQQLNDTRGELKMTRRGFIVAGSGLLLGLGLGTKALYEKSNPEVCVTEGQIAK